MTTTTLTSTSSQTKLSRLCDGVIEAGWLAAIVLSPLFFNVFSSRVFEPDKVSLVRTIALLMALAWLIKIASGGPLWLPALRTGNTVDGKRQPLWRLPFLIPVLLLIVAYLISTVFSVASFVSWFGSYQRLQGTYTFLSYITIAGLTAATLRQPDQLRRLQHAIIITSVPVALYGVVQHFNIDPLPWGGDTSRRITGTAGNAIFLGAHLILAFFFTLERIYSNFAYLLGDGFQADGFQADGLQADELQPKQGDASEHDTASSELRLVPVSVLGVGYLLIAMVQLVAIFWTQSRGPWLGLLAGLYLFVLLIFGALRPKHYRVLLLGWVGAGVLGIGLLVALNTLPIFEPLRDIPYVGRITTLLDQDSNTAQVRLYIWEGAAKMVTPDPDDPLFKPDGTEVERSALRSLVGYGPETMWVAYNPFYPPDLAHHESRNASPDRAHNETWDSLVITGWLGFVAYMSLFLSIFYFALRWLGLIRDRGDSWLFAGVLAAVAAIFTAIFVVNDGSWRYLGVSLPAGLVLGLVAYIMIAAFVHSSQDKAPLAARDVPRLLLILTALSVIVAHFVEIHFGIAIAATRVYFWVTTALLLVVGLGLLEVEPFALVPRGKQLPLAPHVEEGGHSSKHTAAKKPHGTVEQPVTAPAHATLPWLPSTILTDLLTFLTLVYIFTMNRQGLTDAGSVFWQSVTRIIRNNEARPSPGILMLVLVSWAVAATMGMARTALLYDPHAASRRDHGLGVIWWIRGYALHALIVLGAWVTYGLIEGRRLIPGIFGRSVDEQLAQVAGHFSGFAWLMIAWIFAAGVVYAWPSLRALSLPSVPRAGRLAIGLGAGALATVVIFFVISSVNLSYIRADVIYKYGQNYDKQGQWVDSINLYSRALTARETEDHYMLFLGRSLLERAKEAPLEGTVALGAEPSVSDVLKLSKAEIEGLGQEDLLRASEAILLEAQAINPLNTDHTANLARLYRTWSDLRKDDPERKQALLDESLHQYEMAVKLSPNAAHLWNEMGNLRLARGERDLALEAYQHSLALDDAYDNTYLLLANFYEREGNNEEIVRLMEQGVEKIKEVTRGVRESPRMWSYLGVSRFELGDLEGAAEANLEVLALQPTNTGAMRNLAVIYQDLSRNDEAISWAEQAVAATAPEQATEIRRLRNLLIELYQAEGDTAGETAQYEALRQLAPEDVATLNELQSLYREQENWSSAVEVLRTLSVIEPTNYAHPLGLAEVLQQAGQPEDARAFAEQALALAPEAERPQITQLISALGG